MGRAKAIEINLKFNESVSGTAPISELLLFREVVEASGASRAFATGSRCAIYRARSPMSTKMPSQMP